MASSNAVAGSWTLSDTASNVVGVSRGMLEAATTDNVQPLALLACEAFGSTLAMSIETKAKMHHACSQDHQSAVLKFLKAQVGYKRGDSGWQLGRSDSGLRFLGLATCLLSFDLWRGSEMLRKLITETATDKILVPTSQQLKALLLVLQSRLERAGFMNDVLGWNLLLNSTLEEQCLDPKSPSTEVIMRLVKCMSVLGRLGEATGQQTLKVKIPHEQAAWTIAFLKWCLGKPPLVKRDDGVVVVAQDFAQAEVYPIICGSNRPEISVWDELKSVRELFEGLRGSSEFVRGMVSAREYTDALCQRFGPKESPYYLNALELIPYACHEAYHKLEAGQQPDAIEETGGHCDRNDTLVSITKALSRQGVEVTFGGLFPDEATLVDPMTQLDDQRNIHSLKRVPDGLSVAQLAPAVSVRKLFRTSCPCRACCSTAKYPHGICMFEMWLQDISQLVATILLLSMIIPIDTIGVLLHYKSNIETQRGITTLAGRINECLVNEQKPHPYLVSNIIDAVRTLMGHQNEEVAESWIASSRFGQTIYPHLLQSHHVQTSGLLTILCLPGSLSRDNIDYSLVRSPVGLMRISLLDIENASSTYLLAPPVKAQDQYLSTRLIWTVSAQEDSLELTASASGLVGYSVNPLGAIWNAVDSVFVSCPHDKSLPSSDEFLFQHPPKYSDSEIDDPEVGLIFTDRNDVMRYFALCAGVPCVIRHHACLDCCVSVSRVLNVRRVLC